MPNPTSGTKWMYDTTPIPKSVDKDRLIGVLPRTLLANLPDNVSERKLSFYDAKMVRVVEDTFSVEEANHIVSCISNTKQDCYNDHPDAIRFSHYSDLLDKGIVRTLKGVM